MFGKDNERSVIQFDSERRKRMGFLRVIFIVAVVVSVVVIIFSESKRLNIALFGLVMGFGGLLRQHIKVLETENAAVVISFGGILFNGTELGRGALLQRACEAEPEQRGEISGEKR
jgi:hypothetical protein